eukprot:3261022-Amphidinium_carterae.1
MPAPLDAIWYEVWPAISSPSVLERLGADKLQAISTIMRNKAKACGKPSLLRMGYGFFPETRGWEDFTMPLAVWQADC